MSHKDKLILILLISFIIFTTGCTGLQVEKEYPQQPDCKRTMTGALAGVAGQGADVICKNVCQVDGLTYDRWKCSETKDILVCICNR